MLEFCVEDLWELALFAKSVVLKVWSWTQSTYLTRELVINANYPGIYEAPSKVWEPLCYKVLGDS